MKLLIHDLPEEELKKYELKEEGKKKHLYQSIASGFCVFAYRRCVYGDAGTCKGNAAA